MTYHLPGNSKHLPLTNDMVSVGKRLPKRFLLALTISLVSGKCLLLPGKWQVIITIMPQSTINGKTAD
jgi:hypothetical protein